MVHPRKGQWMILIITEERIEQSIELGNNTSKDIAAEMGVHRMRVQSLLKKMADAGTLSRIDLGGTYVYSLKED